MGSDHQHGWQAHGARAGRLPLVTLEEARQVAFDNRRAVRRGENPWADKDAAKVVPVAPTFEEALEAVIAIQREAWRNPRSEAQWRASLRDHALPKLGRMRVDAIQTPDVLGCLERIWHTKRTTAGRVKQRIAAVMDWAIAKGYRQDNPAAAVASVLPKNGKTTKHHAALPWAEVPAAFAKLYDGDAQPGAVFALSSHCPVSIAFKNASHRRRAVDLEKPACFPSWLNVNRQQILYATTAELSCSKPEESAASIALWSLPKYDQANASHGSFGSSRSRQNCACSRMTSLAEP